MKKVWEKKKRKEWKGTEASWEPRKKIRKKYLKSTETKTGEQHAKVKEADSLDNMGVTIRNELVVNYQLGQNITVKDYKRIM